MRCRLRLPLAAWTVVLPLVFSGCLAAGQGIGVDGAAAGDDGSWATRTFDAEATLVLDERRERIGPLGFHDADGKNCVVVPGPFRSIGATLEASWDPATGTRAAGGEGERFGLEVSTHDAPRLARAAGSEGHLRLVIDRPVDVAEGDRLLVGLLLDEPGVVHERTIHLTMHVVYRAPAPAAPVLSTCSRA